VLFKEMLIISKLPEVAFSKGYVLPRSESDIVKKTNTGHSTNNYILFTISHEFHMTILDGKTFSALAEASTQTCGICRALQFFLGWRGVIPSGCVCRFSHLQQWTGPLECWRSPEIVVRIHFNKGDSIPLRG